VLKTETSQTLETEDFTDEKLTLIEVLQTFEVGAESGMFIFTNDL